MGPGQRKSRTFQFMWLVDNLPTSVTLLLPSDLEIFFTELRTLPTLA